MAKFNFDVKLFATVYVDAETEEDARELIDNIVPGLVEGGVWTDRSRRVFINSAGLDGTHDLLDDDEFDDG